MSKSKAHNIFSNSECLSEGQLLRYVQNELSNLERNEVEQHTINCKFCSDAIEGFESIKSISSYQNYKKGFATSKTSYLKYFVGIAASVLIVVLLLNQNAHNKLELQTDNTQIVKTKKKNSNLNSDKDVLQKKESIHKQSKTEFETYTKKPKPLKKKETERLKENTKFIEVDIEDSTFEEDEEEIFEDSDHESSYNKEFKVKLDYEANASDSISVISSNESVVENEPKEVRALNSEKQLKEESSTEKDEIVISSYDLKNKVIEEKEAISSTPIERERTQKTTVKSTLLKGAKKDYKQNNLEQGKEFYNNHQFKKAITVLSKIKPSEITYNESMYYIGKSHQSLLNTSKAKESFNILIQSENAFKKKAEIELKKLNSKSD